MTVKVDITGIEDTQRAMQKAIDAMKPNSSFGKALKATTQHAYDYNRQIIHRDTSANWAAQRMEFFGKYAEIYIDPAAVRSDGKKPSIYGPYEHARGLDHAFYARTVAEDGKAAASAGFKLLLRDMP